MEDFGRDVMIWLSKRMAEYAVTVASRWKRNIEHMEMTGRMFPAATTDRLFESIRVRRTGQFSYDVYSSLYYAQFVEGGRPPGSVSFEHIYEWLLEKSQRYGTSIENPFPVVKEIAKRIEDEGYVGWFHAREAVNNAELFERVFRERGDV